MDCDNARLLLAFARPNSHDLDATDLAELERHLVDCPACAALAKKQRAFDDVVARTMRQIDVPDGLNPQLHRQLRVDLDQRTNQHRVWRAVVAAALLLVIGSGLLLWSIWPLPRLDGEQIWTDLHNPQPSPEEIQKKFRDDGYDVEMPSDLRYNYLKDFDITKFQGQNVPCLHFHSESASSYAEVKILSARRFDFRNQKPYESPPEEGYPKVMIYFSPKGDFAYLITYRGKDLSWLRHDPGGGEL